MPLCGRDPPISRLPPCGGSLAIAPEFPFHLPAGGATVGITASRQRVPAGNSIKPPILCRGGCHSTSTGNGSHTTSRAKHTGFGSLTTTCARTHCAGHSVTPAISCCANSPSTSLQQCGQRRALASFMVLFRQLGLPRPRRAFGRAGRRRRREEDYARDGMRWQTLSQQWVVVRAFMARCGKRRAMA